MPTKTSPLIKKIEAVVPLQSDERDFIAELERDRRTVSARTDLVKQGEKYPGVGILHSGWAIRYKSLSDGRRQIVNFLLPGDAFGLFANLFELSDHSVATLTDASLSVFSPDLVAEMYRKHPKLAAAFAWFSAREEAIIAERATGLGQRTAFERMAHMLLELLKRLEVVALANDNKFELPVTQEILADTLGLSLVHANRTMRKLRESGLIEIEGQHIFLRDVRALADVADFDDLYLYLQRMSKQAVKRFSEAV